MDKAFRTEPQDCFHSITENINNLIGKMTLEEKVRQMSMCNTNKFSRNGKFDAELAQQFFAGMGIGAVLDPQSEPVHAAELVNQLQEFLRNNTRLKIPALVVGKCLHGHMAKDATIFPQSIGLASTWDTKLIKDVASVIAKETRATGVNQGLAPVLDLAREPRWGRVEETFGEDPYLCTRMGVEYIKGLQGESDILDHEHIAATAKHFTAHGSPEGGVNVSPVAVGDRQLRELYFPPFEKAVTEAGVFSIMSAYSEIDGIPCSASEYLLN